jgi:hypothetical protein
MYVPNAFAGTSMWRPQSTIDTENEVEISKILVGLDRQVPRAVGRSEQRGLQQNALLLPPLRPSGRAIQFLALWWRSSGVAQHAPSQWLSKFFLIGPVRRSPCSWQQLWLPLELSVVAVINVTLVGHTSRKCLKSFSKCSLPVKTRI